MEAIEGEELAVAANGVTEMVKSMSTPLFDGVRARRDDGGKEGRKATKGWMVMMMMMMLLLS